jgi:ABC-type lipoprotein release transport system permease subunit
MKKYLIIAWRNLRRNKSRTIITISAVAFATFFAIVMRSFQLGSYDNMINNFVEMYSGFITVEHPRYGDEPSLENSLIQSDETENKILNTPNVEDIQAKISYFSLASYQKQTKGTMISGINPEKQDKSAKLSEKIVKYRITENNLSDLQKLLTEESRKAAEKNLNNSYARADLLLKALKTEPENKELAEKIKTITAYPGQYIKPGDKGVILGDRLARYLKINTGDTLVLIGTGYRASTAAGKFPVRGIIKIPNPKLDGRMIYASLRTVQNYLSAYYTDPESGEKKYLLSSYALVLNDKSEEAIIETKKQVAEKLNKEAFAVKTWKESNKELAQQIESDDKSGQMIMGVLYLVIAFGVFGTVLMMTAERKREMGVMIAIGMKKIKLTLMIAFELLFLGLIGVLSGILLSSPLIVIGHLYPIRFSGDMADIMIQMGFEPIMPMAWFDFYVFNQIYVVMIIVVLVSFYPMAAIRKLKVSDALRA